MKKGIITLLAFFLLGFMTNIALCQKCDISATPREGPEPLSVQFTPIITGGTLISSYWKFGDGYTSSLDYPIHTYNDSGSYNVVAEFEIMSDDYPIPITCKHTTLGGFIKVTGANPSPKIVVSEDTLNFIGPVQFDTLYYDTSPFRGELDGFHYWYPNTRMGMLMSPLALCKIQKVQVYCGSKKQDFKIGIYEFKNNKPGIRLFESQILTSKDEGWFTVDISNNNIEVDKDFVASFNMIDTIATLGYNKWFPFGRAWLYDGTDWFNSSETYFINTIVKYNVPLSEIGTISLKNIGLENLNITKIISDKDWITDINPDTLIIPYKSEKTVNFSFDYSKASLGLNYGKISIFSNDQEKPQYDIIVVLDRLFVGVDDKITFSNQILSLSPNPTHNFVEIKYKINKPSSVTISISNNLGIEVKRLIDNVFIEQGTNSLAFDASGLPSGVYYCTLKTDGYTQTVKLFVTK